ncbi:MAG: hypothetical protein Q8K69_14715, partial [Bacteroidota bacterium]|nr:hypothetical protein [Bacteroidota bacterium]
MHTSEFQNIIQRYFRGQLSDNEYELLTDYLQDSNNRQYFEQAKQEWDQNPELNETVRKNWNRLEYKINKPDSIIVKIPVIRRFWVQVASVAAILLVGLLLGSVVTYFLSGKQFNQEQLVFETP